MDHRTREVGGGGGEGDYMLPSVWLVLVSMREGEPVVGYMVAGEAGEGELSLEPEWSEGGPALWLGEEAGVAQPGPRWAGRR